MSKKRTPTTTETSGSKLGGTDAASQSYHSEGDGAGSGSTESSQSGEADASKGAGSGKDGGGTAGGGGGRRGAKPGGSGRASPGKPGCSIRPQMPPPPLPPETEKKEEEEAEPDKADKLPDPLDDENRSFLEELEPGGDPDVSSLASHLESSRYGSAITQRAIEGTVLNRTIAARRRTGVRRPSSPNPRNIMIIAGPIIFIILRGIQAALDATWPPEKLNLVPTSDECGWSRWSSVYGRDCLCNDTIVRQSAKCGKQRIVCATTPCPYNIMDVRLMDEEKANPKKKKEDKEGKKKGKEEVKKTPPCLCWRNDACAYRTGDPEGGTTFVSGAFLYLDWNPEAHLKTRCPSIYIHNYTHLFRPCEDEDKLKTIGLICNK